MSVVVVTCHGDVRTYPDAEAATETEVGGSLVVHGTPDDKGEARTYALFARGEWSYAELRDDAEKGSTS